MYKRLEKLQVFTEFCGKLLILQRPVHFMVFVMAAKSWNRLGRVYIYTNLGFMLFLKTNYGLYTTGSCGFLLLCSKGSILPWIYCEIFASTESRDCRLRNYIITYLIFTVRHVMQRTVAILSVCLPDACIVTKLNDGLRIFWYHTKGQTLQFSDTNIGWWAMPPSIWNLHSKWRTPFKERVTST